MRAGDGAVGRGDGPPAPSDPVSPGVAAGRGKEWAVAQEPFVPFVTDPSGGAIEGPVRMTAQILKVIDSG